MGGSCSYKRAWSRKQGNSNIFNIKLYLAILIGYGMIQRVFAIECIECQDPSGRARSINHGTSQYNPHSNRVPSGCARMIPSAIRYMRCASDQDICVKITMYGAGVAYGQKVDIVTRRCESLISIRHHNPVLNLTQNYETDNCYTEEEIRSPSPPHNHTLCICHTDLCNSASTIKKEQDDRRLALVMMMVIAIVYVALHLGSF